MNNMSKNFSKIDSCNRILTTRHERWHPNSRLQIEFSATNFKLASDKHHDVMCLILVLIFTWNVFFIYYSQDSWVVASHFKTSFFFSLFFVKSFLFPLFIEHKKNFFHRALSFCYFLVSFSFFFRTKLVIWPKWAHKKWSQDTSKSLQPLLKYLVIWKYIYVISNWRNKNFQTLSLEIMDKKLQKTRFFFKKCIIGRKSVNPKASWKMVAKIFFSC